MLKKWFGKKESQPPEQLAEGTKEAPPDAQNEVAEGDDASENEAETSAQASPVAEPKRSRWSIFSSGLAKTRKGLQSLFSFRRKLDEETIDEIEAELYKADFGPEAVDHLIRGEGGLQAAWKDKKIEDLSQCRDYLKVELKQMLTRRENTLARAKDGPTVVLVAGVNGTGKTTSIAKLTKRLRDQNYKVVLAAADTFRAAAVEQLTIWSERLDVPIVKGEPNADPASVAYKGTETALAEAADYLIVDTAGRLHNQVNLMRELEKIHRVLGKKIPGAPHEALLVLDATTGQNGIQQAREFSNAAEITGIVLAKLDGTARGGIAVTINNNFNIPVKFVGLGEQIDDLQPFDVDSFVDGLLGEGE